MRNTYTAIVSVFLLLLCSCNKEAPEVKADEMSNAPEASAFVAAKAESVVAEKPEASEAAALKYLQEFDAKVGKDAVIPGVDLTTVKYHTGLSHSSEGLVVSVTYARVSVDSPIRIRTTL